MFDNVSAAEANYLNGLGDNKQRIGVIFTSNTSYTIRFAKGTVPTGIVSYTPCEYLLSVSYAPCKCILSVSYAPCKCIPSVTYPPCMCNLSVSYAPCKCILSVSYTPCEYLLSV